MIICLSTWYDMVHSLYLFLIKVFIVIKLLKLISDHSLLFDIFY